MVTLELNTAIISSDELLASHNVFITWTQTGQHYNHQQSQLQQNPITGTINVASSDASMSLLNSRAPRSPSRRLYNSLCRNGCTISSFRDGLKWRLPIGSIPSSEIDAFWLRRNQPSRTKTSHPLAPASLLTPHCFGP